MTTWFERTSTFEMNGTTVTMIESFGVKEPVWPTESVATPAQTKVPQHWWRRLFPLRAYTGEDGRGLGEGWSCGPGAKPAMRFRQPGGTSPSIAGAGVRNPVILLALRTSGLDLTALSGFAIWPCGSAFPAAAAPSQ